MDRNGTVAAIVVTHDRLDQLRTCLQLLREQSRPPDEIIVFDSASSDGTTEYLAGLGGEVSVLRSERNVGGAGGFHGGIEQAWKRGHEWLWLMDDDCAPTQGALESLLDTAAEIEPRPMILASRVLWTGDRRLHPMNRPVPKLDPMAMPNAIEDGIMPLRATSFVSCLIHRDAVDRYGLPHHEYFIWNDDLEFTARVLRHEVGYWVPTSLVFHETPNPHEVDSVTADKFYFEVRNKLFMLRGRSWSPTERLRWGKALAVNVSNFLREHDYDNAAIGAVARGVRDGLLRRLS